MNFFGKRKRKKVYFKGKEEVPVTVPSEKVDELRRSYIRFCAGPTIDPRVSAQEFQQLCFDERVSSLTIVPYDGDPCLIVEVKGVVLRDPNTTLYHDIGDMMIVMRRKPNPELSFFNRTRVIRADTNAGRRSFHHPHVDSQGVICTSHKHLIMGDLAAGQVWSAVEMCIGAILTYGPDAPMYPVINWPLIPRQGGKNA